MGKGKRFPFVVQSLQQYTQTCSDVLEIGCGGAVYKELFHHNRYIGLDLPHTPYAGDGDVSIFGSAQNLPFKDDAFDIIFMVGVLYQVCDVEFSLHEFWRVLHANGSLLIFDYTSIVAKQLQKTEGVERHYWTQWGLRRLVERSGFSARSVVSRSLHLEFESDNSFRLSRAASIAFILLNELRGGWNIVFATKCT